MRVSRVRAIFEPTLYSAASRHFTRIKLMGEDSGTAIGFPGRQFLKALVAAIVSSFLEVRWTRA